MALLGFRTHIFNLTYRIRTKTSNLKTEELRKNIFTCLFSVHNTISSLRHANTCSWRVNVLYTEELLFETNMKLCSMRFEKIKIW